MELVLLVRLVLYQPQQGQIVREEYLVARLLDRGRIHVEHFQRIESLRKREVLHLFCQVDGEIEVGLACRTVVGAEQTFERHRSVQSN